MKVLFVSSGNSKDAIAPIVKAQGISLQSNGIDLLFFVIQGNGIIGYLKNIMKLRRYIVENKINIVHAHYTLSGWVAILAAKKRPVILSLMGDDAYGTYINKNQIQIKSIYLIILSQLIQPFIKAIIVKSKNIEKYVYLKNKTYIIPNGVNLQIFMPKGKIESRIKLCLPLENKIILFLGDLNNPRKNVSLVNQALSFIVDEVIILLKPYPLEHHKITDYLNACDVFVMTSFIEGSPNIIKEAMACNCPIVSTDVGDVRWVIGNTEGCYICDFDYVDVAEKIRMSMEFSQTIGRTNGRQRIIDLSLDSNSIANKIIDVYKKVLRK